MRADGIVGLLTVFENCKCTKKGALSDNTTSAVLLENGYLHCKSSLVSLSFVCSFACPVF
jgi:hypothetical protein